MSNPQAHTAVPYTRLPGRVWMPLALIRAGSVWLGPDHFLTVLENGYAENYKRFYFTDIQGFVVRRSNRRMVLNVLLTLFLLILFLIAYSFNGLGAGVTAVLIFGSPLWIGLVINAVKGPTCTVHVRTAVQLEPVGALQRVRAFEKFYDRVRPLIIQAQGELQSGEGLAAAEAYSAMPKAVEPPPLRSFQPKFHYGFFGLLAFIGVPGFLMFTLPNELNAIFYYSTLGLAFIFGLVAVVRQHADKCKDSALLTLAWLGGLVVSVNGLIHYMQMMFYEIAPPDNYMRGPVYSPSMTILRINPTESEFMFWQISVFLLLAWVIGIFGLLRAWQLRPLPPEKNPS